MLPSQELPTIPLASARGSQWTPNWALVRKAFNQLRPRLRLADTMGLGKTIELGTILSELIARGRADRILAPARQATLANQARGETR